MALVLDERVHSVFWAKAGNDGRREVMTRDEGHELDSRSQQ